jgi:translation initiation factor 3 subunit C
MPFHMHINPDLLELCHLASAMILELPNLAMLSTGAIGPYQNIVSKQFRKYLAGYSRQVFRGPAENTREHVLAATKALLAGEWQKAVDLLMGLEVWKLIPTGADAVKELLRNRMKEEAVRTYLLLNGEHYGSVSLSYVCEMFSMEAAATRRIISRMIFNKEISAAWEHPSDILIVYKNDPTPLQTLAQGLSEKLSLLVESNERIMDPLVGVYGFKDDWQQNRGGGDSRGYNNDSRGGGGAGGNRKYRTAGGPATGTGNNGGGGGGSGGYKSGNRPTLFRQPNKGGRGGAGGGGGRGSRGGASNDQGAAGAKSAWNSASATKSTASKSRPADAQQPAAQSQGTTTKKWGTSA